MSSFSGRNVIRRSQYRFMAEASREVDASEAALGANSQLLGASPLESPAWLMPEVATGEETAEPANNTHYLAEALLTQARAETDRLLTDALKQAQVLRQQAEIEGRRKGYEAGLDEARRAYEEQMRAEAERIHAILESTRTEREQIFIRAEGELVELALTISRKIIGDAVARDVEVLLHMAYQAVEHIGQSGPYGIHLNPEDVERVNNYWTAEGGNTNKSAKGEGNSRPANWELISDERVAPGGCIVACGPSLVDARPETQLALIQQAFRDTRGN